MIYSFTIGIRPKLDFIEQFKVILLSRANKVLGIFEAATGSSTAVLVDPKLKT
jgi:DNA repair protein RadC